MNGGSFIKEWVIVCGRKGSGCVVHWVQPDHSVEEFCAQEPCQQVGKQHYLWEERKSKRQEGEGREEGREEGNKERE